MPYADPDKRRQVKRDSERRRRARAGKGLDKLADIVQGSTELPEPPSRDLLLRALGVQAREGNVPAIRLLLEEYRRDVSDNTAEDPFAEFDELAPRRERRTTGA